MLSRIRSQLPLYRRALRRRRRTLIVLLIAVLAAAVLPSALPTSTRGTTVVVAAADLPAGTTLAPEHLQEKQVAAELAPEGIATTAESLLGSTTALPLTAGTPILPGTLTGKDSAEIPEGRALLAVSAPVQLADRLRPGTELEIHHSTPDPTQPGRTPATVVEVAPTTGASVAGLTDAGADVVVLVTVARGDAADVAHATREGWSILSILG